MLPGKGEEIGGILASAQPGLLSAGNVLKPRSSGGVAADSVFLNSDGPVQLSRQNGDESDNSCESGLTHRSDVNLGWECELAIDQIVKQKLAPMKKDVHLANSGPGANAEMPLASARFARTPRNGFAQAPGSIIRGRSPTSTSAPLGSAMPRIDIDPYHASLEAHALTFFQGALAHAAFVAGRVKSCDPCEENQERKVVPILVGEESHYVHPSQMSSDILQSQKQDGFRDVFARATVKDEPWSGQWWMRDLPPDENLRLKRRTALNSQRHLTSSVARMLGAAPRTRATSSLKDLSQELSPPSISNLGSENKLSQDGSHSGPEVAEVGWRVPVPASSVSHVPVPASCSTSHVGQAPTPWTTRVWSWFASPLTGSDAEEVAAIEKDNRRTVDNESGNEVRETSPATSTRNSESPSKGKSKKGKSNIIGKGSVKGKSTKDDTKGRSKSKSDSSEISSARSNNPPLTFRGKTGNDGKGKGENGKQGKGGKSKDKGSKDKGSKDKGSKDKGSKDKGGKDKGSKDKGSKDKGSKGKGSKDPSKGSYSKGGSKGKGGKGAKDKSSSPTRHGKGKGSSSNMLGV